VREIVDVVVNNDRLELFGQAREQLANGQARVRSGGLPDLEEMARQDLPTTAIVADVVQAEVLGHAEQPGQRVGADTPGILRGPKENLLRRISRPVGVAQQGPSMAEDPIAVERVDLLQHGPRLVGG